MSASTEEEDPITEEMEVESEAGDERYASGEEEEEDCKEEAKEEKDEEMAQDKNTRIIHNENEGSFFDPVTEVFYYFKPRPSPPWFGLELPEYDSKRR